MDQNLRCYVQFEGLIRAYSSALKNEEIIKGELKIQRQMSRSECCIPYLRSYFDCALHSEVIIDSSEKFEQVYPGNNPHSLVDIRKYSSKVSKLKIQLVELEALNRILSAELATKVRLLDELQIKHRTLESVYNDSLISVDLLQYELQSLQLELLENDKKIKELENEF